MLYTNSDVGRLCVSDINKKNVKDLRRVNVVYNSNVQEDSVPQKDTKM